MKYEIDSEIADRIALCSLKDHLSYLQEELKDHKENGSWLHPEDAYKSENVLIPALEAIIDYYGG